MSSYNFEGPSDNDWEDRGELVWNEFDWEQYLRTQDEVVLRYLAFYESFKDNPNRLDEAARLMGWNRQAWVEEPSISDDNPMEGIPAAEMADEESEPYTLYKNPVYIATRAVYLSLNRAWERLATDDAAIPYSLVLPFYSSLRRSEDQAVLAIHALDFGDYAMAISLLKRALRELNASFAFLTSAAFQKSRTATSYAEMAMPRLFDLREIWLRIMSECRDELEDSDSDDDEDDDD